MTGSGERSRRDVLATVAGVPALGALAGCNAPGENPGTDTETARTVDLTDHFLCVVNRGPDARTVSVSVEPEEAGEGVGLTVEVPPESTELRRGLVTDPGPHTVIIQIDGTRLTFSWDVDAEEITGVRVIFDDGTVQAAAGVTEPCTLDAGSTPG